MITRSGSRVLPVTMLAFMHSLAMKPCDPDSLLKPCKILD